MSSRYFFVFFISGAALIGSALFFRSKPQPNVLPPSPEPHSVAPKTVSTRFNATSNQAATSPHLPPALVDKTEHEKREATRLFQELERCYEARQLLKEMRVSLKLCSEETRPEFKESCSRESDRTNARIHQVESVAISCKELNEDELDALRYRSVSEAAKLGDADAQICFIQSNFGLKKQDLSDQAIEQYQIEAISYIHGGLERGDWRIPVLMTSSSQSIAHNRGFLGLVTHGDDFTIYQMTRLLSLGAEGEYARRLSNVLQEYVEASRQGRGLTPNELAAADAWADSEYRLHFADSPKVATSPEICRGASISGQ